MNLLHKLLKAPKKAKEFMLRPENVENISGRVAHHLNVCAKCRKRFESKGKKLDVEIITCMVARERADKFEDKDLRGTLAC